MKKAFIILLSLFVFSCGSHTDVDVTITDENINVDDGFYIGFIGTGANVYITGSRSLITFKQDSVLGNVTITGSNNSITLESGVKLTALEFTGSDNVFYVSRGSGITVDSDTGSGNLIIQQ